MEGMLVLDLGLAQVCETYAPIKNKGPSVRENIH